MGSLGTSAEGTAVVVGAGIAGLAAAGMLARDGWRVTVLEQAPGPRTAGYMIDFFGPGYTAAEEAGMLPFLRPRGHLYNSVRYVDGAGRTTAGLAMGAFLQAAGGRFFSILRPDLEAGLREWLPGTVEIRQGARLRAVEPGNLGSPAGPDHGTRAAAVLESGERVEAGLLVGADGIHSAVRGSLFGPEERFLRLLGYHVAGFVFEDPGLAAQLGRDVALTDSLGKQAGLYALPDGRVAVFAVEATAEAQVPADPRAAVVQRYRDLGWVIPQAMDRAGSDVYYDVVAQSVVPQWRRGRTILTGDAAHAVSLLAGQGASLALAGAGLLTGLLREHGGDPNAAFVEYERRWRPVVAEQQRAGRRNARFFVPPNRRAQWLRRAALWAVGTGPLNRFALDRMFGSLLSGKGGAGR